MAVLYILFRGILLFSTTQSEDYFGLFSRKHLGLTDIPDNIPKGAIAVELSNNLITRITNNTFSNLNFCIRLDLGYNHINQLEDQAFNGLSSLKTLILNVNLIVTLENNIFFHLSSCKTLDLNANLISVVEPNAFDGLTSLEGLNIADNQITTVQQMSFEHRNIRRLELKNNSITTINKDVFSDLISLEEITLYINSIYNIEDGTFKGLAGLVSLSLGSNFLRDLRYGMFQGLRRLVLLDLSYNNINSIENGTFADLTSLNDLYLGGNQLEKLNDESFLGIESLKILYLENNKLTSLDSVVLGELPRPLQMTLIGNYMQCDRKLCWLKQEEQEQSITWLTSSYLRVAFAPECAGATSWKTWQCSESGESSIQSISQPDSTTQIPGEPEKDNIVLILGAAGAGAGIIVIVSVAVVATIVYCQRYGKRTQDDLTDAGYSRPALPPAVLTLDPPNVPLPPIPRTHSRYTEGLGYAKGYSGMPTAPPHPVLSPEQRNFYDNKAIGGTITERTIEHAYDNKSDYHTYLELDDTCLKNNASERGNEHYHFTPISYKDYDYGTALDKQDPEHSGEDSSDDTYDWRPVASKDYANPSTDQGSLDDEVVNIKVYDC